jgi:apolipoprotein N-acyltransferase
MVKWVQKPSLKHISFCAISGLFLGLSQPFYMPAIFGEMDWSSLGLLAFIGYVPLFYIIEKSELKTTFLASFFTLTLQYTIILYWIFIALYVHGEIPSIFAALITLLLPMLLALKGSVFFTIGRFLSARFNFSFYVCAPFALCAADYFRNFYIFGGFPWGNAGYSIGRIDQILQLGSLVGLYGLVFFVGLINAIICIVIKERGNKKSYFYMATAFFLVFGSFIYGAIRLHNGMNEFAPSIRVAFLQGNISQGVKSESGFHANDILDIYFKLQRQAKEKGAELIIWPESAYPKMLDENISDLKLDFDLRVASVIGAIVYGLEPSGKGYQIRNSALLVNPEGQVVKRYDKSHLVPFGEYVPWPMSGIVNQIVPNMGAFKPGRDFTPQNLALNDYEKISIGTTICYEGIFPEITRAYAKNGASLLVNLTNDAWYGRSSAPFQHFLMYRMRSVETGLTFLRATNTGVTGWVDPYGRVHKKLGLFERGLMIDDVPILKKATLYVAVGDFIGIISLLGISIGYIFSMFPIHNFIKRRQWGKIGLILIFFTFAISSYFYYSDPQFLMDESANTKILFIFIFCLFFLKSILSKPERSWTIFYVCIIVLVFTYVSLLVFESTYFLGVLIFGLLLYLLSLRIKVDAKLVK